MSYTPERSQFGEGIMVLPVVYTKGLEFDAVLLWNPTKEQYPQDNGHIKLLYVAATRALHELTVLYQNSLTDIIGTEVPKEKTYAGNFRQKVCKKRKNTQNRYTHRKRSNSSGEKRATGIGRQEAIWVLERSS